MSVSLATLTRDALFLSREERLALACELLDSVDPAPDPGAEALWEEEIGRRIERFKAGEAKPIPAAEVFARLREIAPDR
jgi:putative addiction module component (TIGR02574 family)